MGSCADPSGAATGFPTARRESHMGTSAPSDTARSHLSRPSTPRADLSDKSAPHAGAGLPERTYGKRGRACSSDAILAQTQRRSPCTSRGLPDSGRGGSPQFRDDPLPSDSDLPEVLALPRTSSPDGGHMNVSPESPHPLAKALRARKHLSMHNGATIQSLRLRGSECVILPGEVPGMRCFVPVSAITWSGSSANVDRVAYMNSNWASWNMQLHLGRAIGSHCFPLQDAEPLDLSVGTDRDFARNALERFGS